VVGNIPALEVIVGGDLKLEWSCSVPIFTGMADTALKICGR